MIKCAEVSIALSLLNGVLTLSSESLELELVVPLGLTLALALALSLALALIFKMYIKNVTRVYLIFLKKRTRTRAYTQ